MPSTGKRTAYLRRRSQQAGEFLDRWQRSGGDPGVFNLRGPTKRVTRTAMSPRVLSREEINKIRRALDAWESKSSVRTNRRKLT